MAAWCKFYFCTFENMKFKVPTGYVFGKFGITQKKDILARFDPSVDDGYFKSPKYLDWKISPTFSMWCKKGREQAEEYEQGWLTQVFPNPGPTKVWVERVLGCPTNDYYSDCSGITELRLLPKDKYYWVLKQLYAMRNDLYEKNS